MARVIGPTPPGTGATQEATSWTLASRSPAKPGLGPGDADVHADRSGLDHVAGDQPGPPGRGDDDVGGPGVRGDVDGAGVAERHRGVLALAGQQQPKRPADRGAAADDADLGPAQRYAVAAQQLDDAAWRAGQRRRLAQHQLAQVDRVQAVGVLAGVDQPEGPVVVQATGERQLHDVAGAGRVGVQPGDLGVQLGLADRCRQLDLERGDAHLGAVAVLAGDVRLAARVVPDQHGAQPRRDALGQKGLDPDGQVGLDGGRQGLAVQQLCGHVVLLSRAGLSGRSVGRRSGTW